MSHLKERKEKICLNCSAELYGRYCHVCGQENLEPKETVWHLVNHFFQDITHFDGKFFSTVKYLITKPGFLSKEYMLGRRASYLNPIRMYVFTSAFFFVMLFSLTNADKIMKINETEDKPKNEKTEGIQDWEKEKTRLQKQLALEKGEKDADTAEIADNIKAANAKIAAAKKIYGDTTTRRFDNKELAILMDSLKAGGMPEGIANKMNDALAKRDSTKIKDDGYAFFDVPESRYPTVGSYDSAQDKLPSDKRDGWIKRMVRKKAIAVRMEVNKDKRGYFEHFREKFLHSFPKILFISLPFFALILKFVYIRRKQFYYTSHGIFTIHVYCATFILLMVLILSNQLGDMITWKWLKVVLILLDVAVWVYMFFYLYKAMRIFYGQRRFKTLMKYLIVSFLAFIVNILLLTLFILISAISV